MNIIKLIGIVLKDSNSIPYMVFEYMLYGDLAELLRSKKSIQQTCIEYEYESIDEIKSEKRSTGISHVILI
jgi:serine/threonine protein kinase